MQRGSFYNNNNDFILASNGLYALINVAFNQVAGWATCYGSDDVAAFKGGNKLSFSDFDLFEAQFNTERPHDKLVVRFLCHDRNHVTPMIIELYEGQMRPMIRKTMLQARHIF